MASFDRSTNDRPIAFVIAAQFHAVAATLRSVAAERSMALATRPHPAALFGTEWEDVAAVQTRAATGSPLTRLGEKCFPESASQPSGSAIGW